MHYNQTVHTQITKCGGAGTSRLLALRSCDAYDDTFTRVDSAREQNSLELLRFGPHEVSTHTTEET